MARNNHARKGFDMSILATECLEELAKSTRACRYCGGPIIYAYGEGCGPSSPSLDRTDNKEGTLLPEDVQIICYRCSNRKKNKTDAQFLSYLKK
jgi:hypothetical protein